MIFLAAVLAAAPSQQFSWTVSSASGTAVLTQTALPDDACTLKCEVKGKQSWSHQSCLGRVTDFAFPADDCSRVVMLVEYPLRASPTEATVAAVALSAAGTPVTVTTRVYRMEELVDVSRLRGEGKRVRWLAGVAGEPGAKPHFNAEGTGIEFGTTEGTRRAVRFGEELALMRVSAAPSATAGPATNGLYQYTGADGSTHFVMGLAQVPKKYRKGATPVESEIDSVESEKLPRSNVAPDLARRDDLGRSPAAPPTTFEWPAPARTRVSPPREQIFGLPGPAGDAVILREQMRLNGNNLPNSSPPPALPPKPPGPQYVPPPSPYGPPAPAPPPSN